MICSPPQLMWDNTIHPPSGPSVLAGTLSFLQSMWDRPQIHPLWDPTSFLAHRLVSTPLRRTAKRLTHRPVSGFDTICNDPDPPLVDISLGFPFRASPQGFKTRLLGESFRTLINGDLFSSPTNVGHHISTNFYTWTKYMKIWNQMIMN